MAQDSTRPTSEDDYFANVPVVLTASRLDQPLNEAPGAITVITRDIIRMSGARTLAEVLRLVPGYLSGGFNGANPNAVYHVPLDDYGARNLVLIDGRSVYSSVYMGNTHRGMQDVMLEDIERVEVLRGANSAAYGSNAMFGVINIITRHSADTIGAEASFTKGNQQVWDRRVRIGAGDDKASVRLSAGEQRDSGYLNTFDDRRISQLNLRSDFKPTWADEVMLSAGISRQTQTYGTQGELFDPVHPAYSRNTHVTGQWRRQISSTDEFQLSANVMEGWVRDATAITLPVTGRPSVTLDFSSLSRRANLEGQRKFSINETMRAVVGLGLKEEHIQSQPLYSRSDWLNSREQRAFGTLEWRARPDWLLNAGLFVGHHSEAGTYTAPRLMANWLPTPEHTFRAGVTRSVRTPNLSEYVCDTRYYIQGQLAARDWACTGNVQPEHLTSQELGYLGRWTNPRVTLDVRAYRERMDTVISSTSYDGGVFYPLKGSSQLRDYENKPGIVLKGIESQLRWQPAEGAELWLNHSYSKLHWYTTRFQTTQERDPPAHTFTLAWFQRLGGHLEFSVLTQRIGPMTWRDNRDMMPTTRRTDVRIAKSMRIQDVRAELSYTVQSLEGTHPFFLVRKDMAVGLRSFVQLKLEM